jgi:hypothetical protein
MLANLASRMWFVVGHEGPPVSVQPEADVCRQSLSSVSRPAMRSGTTYRHRHAGAEARTIFSSPRGSRTSSRPRPRPAREQRPVSLISRGGRLVGAVDVDRCRSVRVRRGDPRSVRELSCGATSDREPEAFSIRRARARTNTPPLDPFEPHHHSRLDHSRASTAAGQREVPAPLIRRPSILDGGQRGKIVRIPTMRIPPLLPSPKKLVQGEGAFPRPEPPSCFPRARGERFFPRERSRRRSASEAGLSRPSRPTPAATTSASHRASSAGISATPIASRSRGEASSRGRRRAGLRYAVESLSQLLPRRVELAACEIEDAPISRSEALPRHLARKVPTLFRL